MGIDRENHLFRNLSDFFTGKIERSVYNRRRRKLAVYTDQIRLKLAETCYQLNSSRLASSCIEERMKT